MQRREFVVTLVGAVAVAPTLRARSASAQQGEKVRHIGVLMGLTESDPEFRGFVTSFVQELARLAWIDGRNARIEQSWTTARVPSQGRW